MKRTSENTELCTKTRYFGLQIGLDWQRLPYGKNIYIFFNVSSNLNLNFSTFEESLLFACYKLLDLYCPYKKQQKTYFY